MINDDVFQKISFSLKGSKIYLNPLYYKDKTSIINISPLLFDKTLIYIDKNEKTLNNEMIKVKEYHDCGFCVPVAISKANLPSLFSDDDIIFKNELFDKMLFRQSYNDAIKDDTKDEQLNKQFGNKEELLSFSFNANWDLLLMNAFDLSMYSPSCFKNQFIHKLSKLNMEMCSTRRELWHQEIKEFLNDVSIYIPNDLTVDDICEIRKDKAAIQFRNWLEERFAVYSKTDNIDNSDFSKGLIKDFKELTATYDKGNDFISASFNNMFFTLGGATIGGVLSHDPLVTVASGTLSSFVAPTIQSGLSKAYESIQKNTSKNKWTFVLNDIHKSKNKL